MRVRSLGYSLARAKLPQCPKCLTCLVERRAHPNYQQHNHNHRGLDQRRRWKLRDVAATALANDSPLSSLALPTRTSVGRTLRYLFHLGMAR